MLGMFKEVGLGGQQGTGWLSLSSGPVAPPFGTRVSDQRLLPRVAPERRFRAMWTVPPPLPFFLPLHPLPPSSACSHWAGSSRQHKHPVGTHSSAPGASFPQQPGFPTDQFHWTPALVPSAWETAALRLHSLIPSPVLMGWSRSTGP